MRILNSRGPDIHNIREYYNGSYILDQGRGEEKVDIKLNYTKRLAINDWTLIANRCAAEIFYNKWFEAMLATWYYDYNYRDKYPEEKWYIRSEQCIQGNIIEMNNVFAEQLVRRDTKVYDSTHTKDQFSTTKNIDINKSIQPQLIKRFKR